MAKIVFPPGRTNNARHTAVPTGRRLDVHDLPHASERDARIFFRGARHDQRLPFDGVKHAE
jgi:hypothetical protein